VGRACGTGGHVIIIGAAAAKRLSDIFTFHLNIFSFFSTHKLYLKDISGQICWKISQWN